eukprot:4589601-Prymnesium_polylepis.2
MARRRRACWRDGPSGGMIRMDGRWHGGLDRCGRGCKRGALLSRGVSRGVCGGHGAGRGWLSAHGGGGWGACCLSAFAQPCCCAGLLEDAGARSVACYETHAR